MKSTSWVALAVLAVLIGVIVWSSLDQGGVHCEVCITYRGREACRAVDGGTEEDARRGAVTNTCAFLASGVTESMACERTAPSSSSCRAR